KPKIANLKSAEFWILEIWNFRTSKDRISDFRNVQCRRILHFRSVERWECCIYFLINGKVTPRFLRFWASQTSSESHQMPEDT
ncbi:hypothetical protein K0M31_011841, partial [Melipona bicolor]